MDGDGRGVLDAERSWEDAAVDGGTVPSGRQKKSENLALDNWSLSCLKNGLGFGFQV